LRSLDAMLRGTDKDEAIKLYKPLGYPLC